eukprot:jgi/Botrbrau1/16466/Bobra.0142s0060.2
MLAEVESYRYAMKAKKLKPTGLVYVQASGTDSEDNTEETTGNIVFGNVLGLETGRPSKRKMHDRQNAQAFSSMISAQDDLIEALEIAILVALREMPRSQTTLTEGSICALISTHLRAKETLKERLKFYKPGGIMESFARLKEAGKIEVSSANRVSLLHPTEQTLLEAVEELKDLPTNTPRNSHVFYRAMDAVVLAMATVSQMPNGPVDVHDIVLHLGRKYPSIVISSVLLDRALERSLTVGHIVGDLVDWTTRVIQLGPNAPEVSPAEAASSLRKIIDASPHTGGPQFGDPNMFPPRRKWWYKFRGTHGTLDLAPCLCKSANAGSTPQSRNAPGPGALLSLIPSGPRSGALRAVPFTSPRVPQELRSEGPPQPNLLSPGKSIGSLSGPGQGVRRDWGVPAEPLGGFPRGHAGQGPQGASPGANGWVPPGVPQRSGGTQAGPGPLPHLGGLTQACSREPLANGFASLQRPPLRDVSGPPLGTRAQLLDPGASGQPWWQTTAVSPPTRDQNSFAAGQPGMGPGPRPAQSLGGPSQGNPWAPPAGGYLHGPPAVEACQPRIHMAQPNGFHPLPNSPPPHCGPQPMYPDPQGPPLQRAPQGDPAWAGPPGVPPGGYRPPGPHDGFSHGMGNAPSHPPLANAPVPVPHLQNGARSRLHSEIVRFAGACSLSSNDQTAISQAMDAVCSIVRYIWPRAAVHLFGSQATGLALPGSDLDVVVLGASPLLQNAAQGFSKEVRDEIAGRLRILLRHMRASRLVRKAIVIGRAKVPIIKATLEPAGLQMDISMGTLNGHQAVDFINRQVQGMPPLRALVLFLKALLKEAGLNEVYMGGLSSYSVTLMVISHLLQSGYQLVRECGLPAHLPQPGGASSDCGNLLIGFLERFGRHFNYEKQAVSVERGGFMMKEESWRNRERAFALAIEDPQEPGRDIAGGSYRIADVRLLFCDALQLLRQGGSAEPSFLPGGSSAPSWEQVQADGASRSVGPGPPAGGDFPLLNKLFSVDSILLPSRMPLSQPRASPGKWKEPRASPGKGKETRTSLGKGKVCLEILHLKVPVLCWLPTRWPSSQQKKSADFLCGDA